MLIVFGVIFSIVFLLIFMQKNILISFIQKVKLYLGDIFYLIGKSYEMEYGNNKSKFYSYFDYVKIFDMVIQRVM